MNFAIKKKPKVVLPKLKVLDPADFKLVNGGNGDGSTSTDGNRVGHTAGASAEV
ncbi:hypothetical protein OA2633_05847 [Oceanicaulis alexandrii HTCC2633]|uniref:hypothetical protein n=1 Tax=Oceanicaulis sp. HTCC2633 TaxID=314254 RepID=UPI000066C974|nr:hypothetical protein [Oceanicaulis sp. HTCC2633]EAP88697.1 hypothetical protein OA2633_05847 [Oceanicaulis alexandrii HTCC2633] [Oceanicaulis sp. HTCC2633]